MYAEPSQLESTSIQTLMNWDLSGPKARVAQRLGLTQAQIDAMEREYKRFLSVAILNDGQRFAITPGVDHLWHEHLLFTRDYARMCEETRGRFLHHDPVHGDDVLTESRRCYFENTLPGYRSLFGEPDGSFWPQDPEALHCSMCGDD